MQKLFARLGTAVVLVTLVGTSALAKPPAHHVAKHVVKKATQPKCPVCGMFLASKKTAKMTRMVKIHGKTYYCCTKCDMSKMEHHNMKHMHPMHKPSK
jgi:YHS domain-containing protein